MSEKKRWAAWQPHVCPTVLGTSPKLDRETFRVLARSFFTKAKTERHIQNVSLFGQNLLRQ